MNQKNRYEIDMCSGSLMDKLILFSLPLMLSGILQLMFNAVDLIVVGRFSGPTALAAVGSTTALIAVFINLFIGVSQGTNVLAARFFASQQKEKMSETVHTSIWFALVSGIVMAVVGLAFSRGALQLMATPEDVIDQSSLYMRIYFLGMPFFMLYNYGAAVLRAIGDTRRPLLFLIIAGATNAILNLIFVAVFGLGVAGVAIATVISQMISCVLVLGCLIRTDAIYRLEWKKLRVNRWCLGQIFRVGIPAGVQSTVINFSNVLLQSSVNSFGSTAMAGYTAANNLFGFMYTSVNAVTQACMSFTSQNYGAGQMQRVKRIFWLCMAMSVVGCGLANLLFVWQDDFFLNFFSTDAVVHEYGAIRLHTVLAFQWLACSYEISGSSLRGMGRSLMPTLFTVVGTCLLRIVWVYVVCPNYHGFKMLMSVYPISWVLTGLMVVTAFAVVLRKESRRLPEK